MKKTLFKSVLCATLFVGALTSCNEVEDLYNPELVREQAKKALGLDIAADQDWNMTSVVTANITLNEDALSDYSFRIYSSNPTNNANSVVLANYPVRTDAQGKANASFKFEMPSYLEHVYVARVDNHGRRMIGVSNVENGTINKAFGESTSTSTKAITDYDLPTMDAPYTVDEVNNLISTSTEINNVELINNTIRIIGNVVVKSTVNGKIDFNAYYYEETRPQQGTNKLIIADGATVEITNSQLSGMDIIVANGGTLKINGHVGMLKDARLIVMEGGNVINEYDASAVDNEQNININLSDDSELLIYNEGTMDFGNLNITNNGKFYNAETGVVKAKTINLSNQDDEIYNWGKIEAGQIVGNYGSGQGQGILHNGCLIRCDKIKVLQLNLNANAAFESEYVSSNAYYLREYSIVRAKTIAANGYNIKYVGKEGEKALMSSEILSATYFVHADANIYVETTNIYQGDTYNDWFNGDIRAKVNICPIGEAPLIISAEKAEEIKDADCVGEGNTPKDEVIEDLLDNSNIYAFEDMSINGGDYDMNDVVLECTKLDNNKISIKLIAAGATKKVYAFFRDTRSNAEPINLFGEIHEAFGQQSGIIINTGVDVNDLPPVETIIDVEEGFLFSEHGDIYIVDYQNREAHISKFTNNFQPGDAPYGILVPITWKYPKEWVKISTAYPEFAAWAGGDNTASGWYTHPSSSNVY